MRGLEKAFDCSRSARRRREGAVGETLCKPEDGGFKIEIFKMNDKINRPSASFMEGPVHKLLTGDADCAF